MLLMDTQPPGDTTFNITGTNAQSIDAQFSEKTGTLPRDYVGDWIAELKTLNKTRMEECNDFGEIYSSREMVEYIFTLCIRLRMPVEVRFMAVAIFDRFMQVHTRQMMSFLSNVDMENQRKKEEWDGVETNMSRQLTLRICSAIQIASKSVSYHDSLSSNQIGKCLRTLGTPYTKSAVLKSEIRLLKAIEFRIPPSQVVYAESVLKLFSMKRPDLQVNSVWSFMCILMDVLLIESEMIYDNLISSIIGDTSHITRADKNRLKSDWILLACALVCAGSCCHYGFQIGDAVSTELEQLCETPAKDTTELAIAMLEVARTRKGGVKRELPIDRQCTPPPNKRFARGREDPREESMPFSSTHDPLMGKETIHPTRDHRSYYAV